MFTRAIVRKPGKSLVEGISSANLGKPDYHMALAQHGRYVQALRECGLEVRILEADESYPDSVFVEDTALLTPQFALITNPGVSSRRGETNSIKAVLQNYYSKIEQIHPPGTLEAGDVMMVDNHFYIGLSERTNREGADQAIAMLEKFGMTGSLVKLEDLLHLKTGTSYLENNTLLATGELSRESEFREFKIIEIPDEESYAANCVWINGKVLVPDGFPYTHNRIQKEGFEIISLEMSEFQKLDGGLSCLSLRF